MSVIYRPANLEDKPALDACLQHIITAERPMDPCLQSGDIEYYDPLDFIKDENATLIVAQDGDQIVGCGAGRIAPNKPYYRYDRCLYLAMMYVAQSHRGQGINGVIMETLIEWGKAKGVTNAKLTVYPGNPSAIRAYEKLGFETALLEMRLRPKTDENIKN